jgi:hypothetical protein
VSVHVSKRGTWLGRGTTAVLVAVSCVVLYACIDEDPKPIGYGTIDAGGGVLVPPDVDVPEGPISYCPSDKCPEGYTTCPESRFPCDVNLRTSRDHCGACGAACPAATLSETFECVEGSCVLRCELGRAMDCDGILDNGCESFPGEDRSCGACGVVCSDPAKPCMNSPSGYHCGCPDSQLTCLEPFPHCAKGREDDYNCGTCGKVCEPTPDDGGTPPENAYYGCVEGKCGGFKCQPDYGNCDGDKNNGCETSLTTRDDCGACGNACPDGQTCEWAVDGTHKCMCPPGLTFCGGICADLASDPKNCGVCERVCHDDHQAGSFGVCSYGICSRKCATGLADCNGNPEDGCEVNVQSDPQNCGGCGVVCDAIAGQACVVGKCVVEPCAPNGGTVAR